MQPSRTIAKGVALVGSLVLVGGLVSNRAGIWHFSKPVPLAISVPGDLLQSPAESVETIVFTLLDVNADVVASGLNALFGNEIQNHEASSNTVAPSGSKTLPLKFTVGKQENTITASGPRDALRIVELLVRRLEGSNLVNRRYTVIRLSTKRATEIAESFAQFFESQREMGGFDPNLDAMEKEVIVIADPANNSLLVSSSPRYFKNIEQMILKIDTPPAPPQEAHQGPPTMIGGSKSMILFSPASTSATSAK